jgi:abequosyltransferase
MTNYPNLSDTLAICIPTRNRPAVIARTLTELIERTAPYQIHIYVSDNSTNTETLELVTELLRRHSHLHYSKCERDLGADENFERALKLPKTKYRWLFGDRYRIDREFHVERLLELLPDNHELIAVNARGRVRNIPSGAYSTPSFVMEELGWHLTMMTCLIYSRELVARLDFQRYYGTFLTQTLSVLESFSRNQASIYWLEDFVVDSDPISSEIAWHERALTVFVRDWFYGVLSLSPQYSPASKQRLLLTHSVESRLFSPKSILYLRSIGAISLQKVRAVHRELPFVVTLSQRLLIYIACFLPQNSTALAIAVYKTLKKAAQGRLPSH